MKYQRKLLTVVISIMMACIFTACGKEEEQTSSTIESLDTGFHLAEPGSYDCADTAVITNINQNEAKITFRNLDINREYTLSYDGVTCVYDRYGEAMSVSQIVAGDIVDLTFLKGKKRCNTIQLSPEAWTLQNINNYVFDDRLKNLTIANDIYKYQDDVVILSDAKEVEMMDINTVDTLSFQGIGSKLYSVVINKGHGYLKLLNDEYFIDGWIEVGQSIIQKVTEGMVIAVPEGSYQVLITNNGSGGTKNIIVNRNEELELDVGDLKGEEVKNGTVIFTIYPTEAELFIDGLPADFSAPVTLEYGIHQMIVRCAGYDSITQYIKVGQEAAGVEVTLEQEADDSEILSGNNVVLPSTNTTTTTTPTATTSTTGNKVSIDAPTGAEVYVDSNYVGISPCSFTKTAGSHVVTLRKTGYTTKSYTIQLDSEQKDVNYSFLDLVLKDGDND